MLCHLCRSCGDVCLAEMGQPGRAFSQRRAINVLVFQAAWSSRWLLSCFGKAPGIWVEVHTEYLENFWTIPVLPSYLSPGNRQGDHPGGALPSHNPVMSSLNKTEASHSLLSPSHFQPFLFSFSSPGSTQNQGFGEDIAAWKFQL